MALQVSNENLWTTHVGLLQSPFARALMKPALMSNSFGLSANTQLWPTCLGGSQAQGDKPWTSEG